MKTLWEWESSFIRLMAKIKETGIKIDKEFCKPKVIQGTEICYQIRNELGWNPGSSKQIGEVLIGQMNFPVFKTSKKTGQPSFDKFAMEEYELLLEAEGSDLAQKILRYRGWAKTVSSNYRPYIELADSDGVLHPNYKVHGTVTGRLSCELPNLQQIPRSGTKEWNGDLKSAFIPRSDTSVLVEFDFSQLEFRLAAAYAHEHELLEIFNAEGSDIFTEMAQRLGWERQDIKTLVYATLYNAGITRISTIFNISKQSAKDRLDEFYSLWPGLRAASKKAGMLALNKGYVQYWTGRRRHFDDRKEGAHKAFNSIVQGGAFEIVKRSMLRLDEELENNSEIDSDYVFMTLQVHDSVTIEMPLDYYNSKFLTHLKTILEDVPESNEMGVKFKVDYKVWSH